MDTYDFNNKYWKFFRENYSDICHALRESYNENYGYYHERTTKYSGFGSRVALLLGFLFLICCNFFESNIAFYLCAALFAVIWYVLNLFFSNSVHYAYRELFWQREYKETLANFIEKKRLEKLSQEQSAEERDLINQEFDYYKHSIQLEIIHFYKK